MNYKLKLDVFEGPLDLLLYLIKKDDVDIKNIPIVAITEQYMQYIEMMKMMDLDVVGDFLVMAATLMHIKSKMLLPSDPVEESEEDLDPLDDLTRRLLEYKKFKEIAGDLQEKEQQMKDYFPRVLDEEERKRLQNDAKEVYLEANLFDLISALSEALNSVPEEATHEIAAEEFTVEQKINEVVHLLLEQSSFVLNDAFRRARSKIEAVVTFLAILELIRLKEIRIVQKKVFSDIEVIRTKDNIIPIEEGVSIHTSHDLSAQDTLEEEPIKQVEEESLEDEVDLKSDSSKDDIERLDG
ncbi:MAG: segregation and condensation protein A [Candidatus Omnitrophota bacterium]|jgi:segregation and condensation protein A